MDLTDYQRTDTAFDFLDDPDDVWYFGLDRRIEGIYVELESNGSYEGLVVEYYADGSWIKCSTKNNYGFDSDGYWRWVVKDDHAPYEIGTTEPHVADPPAEDEAWHWVRIYASGVTGTAKIEKIRAISYVTYCTVPEISGLMQIKGGFDYENTPTILDVEKFIRRQEDRIDYLTRKSWRFNIRLNEESGFNVAGIRLQYWPIIKLYDLSIWTGSSWETKRQGRKSDFFTVDQFGMVKFSRFFMLPARFAYIPPGLGRWDFGEFAFPVRTTYSWGRDPEIDSQFGIVQDTCAKLVAADVFNAFDKTIYIRSGIDKVSYDRKVENWRSKADEQIEELRAIVLW